MAPTLTHCSASSKVVLKITMLSLHVLALPTCAALEEWHNLCVCLHQRPAADHRVGRGLSGCVGAEREGGPNHVPP